MLALILLLALGLQAKPTPPVIEETQPLDPLDHMANPTCQKFGNFYEYDGYDGLAGYSTDSCNAAYKNWQTVVAPKPQRLA